jgi:hypothetical protein
MKILLSTLFLICLLKSATAQDNHNISNLPFVTADNSKLLNTGRFEVAQNVPNPFNVSSDISFACPVQCFVEFKIVNLIGKQVMREVLEADAGLNNIHVEGADLLPGVYIYSVSNGSVTLTRRMIISKK